MIFVQVEVGAAHLVRPFTAANEMLSEHSEDEAEQGGENDYENEFEQVCHNNQKQLHWGIYQFTYGGLGEQFTAVKYFIQVKVL